MSSHASIRMPLLWFSVAWAICIGVVGGLFWLPATNHDARPLGAAVLVAAFTLAVLAARMLHRGRWRWGGLALLLSACAPTGFAYLGNLLAFLVGLWLLAPGSELTEAPTRPRFSILARSTEAKVPPPPKGAGT